VVFLLKYFEGSGVDISSQGVVVSSQGLGVRIALRAFHVSCFRRGKLTNVSGIMNKPNLFKSFSKEILIFATLLNDRP
jgi:hypothetical protein